MSQEDLAAAVGTDKSVISLLERGKRKLTGEWATRVAPILGTTPGLLFDHSPQDLPTELLYTWELIPSEQKAQALAVLKTFVKAA